MLLLLCLEHVDLDDWSIFFLSFEIQDLKLHSVRVEDPVWHQPVLHVEVARHCDELLSCASDGFLQRERSYLCNVSVYDGREFVEDKHFLVL